MKQVIKPDLQGVLNSHAEVFREDLGLCTDFKAHLYLKQNARPVFCKARPVPFAVKVEVENGLNRLVKL